MTPRVSVIMPTRNRSGTLPRALTSVLAQSMPNWELIVIDDGSTDNTPDFLSAAVADDARIHTLRTEGIGAAAARNRGLAAAVAPYVAFLDDDDEWLPRKLELQLALAASDALVYAGYVEVHDGVERAVRSVQLGVDAHRTLLRGNQLANSTVLAPRDAVLRVGAFDERLPRLQDWDLWLRLAPSTRFCLIPEPLARIHRTTESISASLPALLEACAILAEKVSALPRSRRADGYFGLAHTLLFAGADKMGRVYMRRSLRAAPWSVKRWLLAAIALFAGSLYRKSSVLHARMLQMRGAP